jgi:20S proteasome alpha/beta subunit
MTTIAWDGHTLAADTRCSSGGMVFRVSKIRRCPDGRLIGGSGESGAVEAFMTWLQTGNPDGRPEFQDRDDDNVHVLEVRLDGTVWWHGRFAPFRVCQEFIAIGSGQHFAMAAMAMGAGAKRAVEIACRFDAGSGEPVETLHFVGAVAA